MDPTYGEVYRTLYEQHWWWRARESLVLRTLQRHRPAEGWRRALDVGCGDGLLLDALTGLAQHVEGLEPDEAIVSQAARSTGRIHVGQLDAGFEPAAPFDLVLFLDVLEHIPDVRAALARTHEIMMPGGTLLVTVPAFMHLWTSHDDLNRHVTRYTRTRLVDLLSEHFVVRRARYFFRWVHLAKLAQRLVEKAHGADPTPPEVPPAIVNSALLALSRAEEALLGWAPIPLGSSVLALAHRR